MTYVEPPPVVTGPIARQIDTMVPAVRLLGPADFPAFRSLARESGLPGLADPYEVANSPGCLMLIAALGETVVGCAGLRPDVQHGYLDGTMPMSFPIPNIYLFGAYVRPEARGKGIGRLLYSRRLSLAELIAGGPIIVELLGDGTADSVHPDTWAGLRFHRTEGFQRIGYSPDPDGGVILARLGVSQ